MKNKSNTSKANGCESSLNVVNPDAAAIDLGSTEHYVWVPTNRDKRPIQHFGVVTIELKRMMKWLKKCRIKTVAMESTGVYWVPVYDVLEEAGFEVLLVDARKVMNVTGRKTDVKDCEWIGQLHRAGLLSASFIPSLEIRSVRAIWRSRQSVMHQCRRQIQLMQKALEQMNIQIHKVLSDISGTSGMGIIRTILKGERDPKVLLNLVDRRVKAKPEDLIEALRGNFREELLYTLKMAVEGYDFFQKQADQCKEDIGIQWKKVCQKRCELMGKENLSISPSEVDFDGQDLMKLFQKVLGTDLTVIKGIGETVVQTFMTEIGPDLSKFRSAKAFASYLGLCPNNRITGGKIKSRRTRKVHHRFATVLRQAAMSFERVDTGLGANYRRLKRRIGAPKAITAMARKLAVLIYNLVRFGWEYVEKSAEEYEKLFKARQIKAMRIRAKALGFDLVDCATGQVLK
jgi:transposase